MKIGDKISIELEAIKPIVSGSCIGCFYDHCNICNKQKPECKEEDLIFVVVEKSKIK
jgi:hypothetical protein